MIHLNLIFGLVWGQIMVQPWPESLVSSPGPSSWQVPNSNFPLARLLKTEMIFRGFLLLLFSLQSSYTPSSGNVLKGNPAVCWRPPHVSTTDSLVSLSPDSQLLPGPQMGEHPGGWRAAVGVISPLWFYSLPSQPLSCSPLPSDRWFLHRGTFLVLLDRSTGLLQVTWYHLQ